MVAKTPQPYQANPEAKGYWQTLEFHAEEVKTGTLSACPTCGGAGFVRQVKRYEGQIVGKEYVRCPNPTCERTQTTEARRNDMLYKTAAIPAEYSDLSFERWEKLWKQQPEALTGKLDAVGAALAFRNAQDRGFFFTLEEAAQLVKLPPPEFKSRPKCSLVLSGLNGIGKTSLAVSIAKDLLEHKAHVLYLRFGEFFDGLKERFEEQTHYQYFPELHTETEVMTHFQSAPVLILDEFYADVTDWRRERAEQLINYRYTHQLPTIITTNLDADRLIELWGTTTGHRIQAMSHWVQMGGEELRSRAAAIKSR